MTRLDGIPSNPSHSSLVHDRPFFSPCVANSDGCVANCEDRSLPNRAEHAGGTRSRGVFFLSLLLLCASCDNNETPKPADGQDAAARTQIERGPVRVTVAVEPHPMRLSDEPRLTLTIDHEMGVDVESPPFGAEFGSFIIRDFHEPLPRTNNDRRIIQQVYTLEPTVSGEFTFPPIPIRFVDNRPNGDGKEHTMETESFRVEVASVVESDLPSLDELKPMADPVQLPESPSFLLWGAVICGVVFVGAAVVWGAFRKRKEEVEPELSPREWAYLELQALLECDLAEKDVKEFYVRLTGIVRLFIERTTGVHAPEQTTEEFLYEIKNRDVFDASNQQRLGEFLAAADLVKYAAFHPQAKDIEEMFNLAKVFIGFERRSEVAA